MNAMPGNDAMPAEGLEGLFRIWAGANPEHVQALPKAGGDRQYYRLSLGDQYAIGVKSPDLMENRAFLSFSRHFREKGIHVPEIFAASEDESSYLQQDLGDLSLLEFLQRERKGKELPDNVRNAYKAALEELARMQILGGKRLDYSLCQPRPDFDAQSMRWDLNYFKYYFLRLAKVPLDEQALEDDFERLTSWLCEADCSNFMFRDFQARNIMMLDGQPWFIDYQGGRRGALQYDVASLLYQAKANLPEAERQALLQHYIAYASQLQSFDKTQFERHFQGYLLIRMLQTLGSYGFRGFYERRPHFRDSIPYALENLAELIGRPSFPIALPTLFKALEASFVADEVQLLSKKPESKALLILRVKSFSYKAGLPADPSGNGGGFYFDCRAVHNPGRFEEYKVLTGRDQPVISFLEALPETQAFYKEASTLVEASVRRYLERGFSDLMACFGCTGGQHRSVYFADRLAKEMQSRFPIQVELEHVEQEKKNWRNG